MAALAVVSNVAAADPASVLSTAQRLELAIFGMKAMGLPVSPKDVSKVPTSKETIDMVATGINLNGHLCAAVVSLVPLKVRGGWEVTCIANRGGSAKKSYTIDTGSGKADAL